MGAHRVAVLVHGEVQVGLDRVFRGGGGPHRADEGSGGHRVPHRHVGDGGQVGVLAGQALPVVDLHRGAHEGVLEYLGHRARGGGDDLGAQGDGQVHPVMGAPVPHGLAVGQGLHRVVRDDRAVHRPCKDQGGSRGGLGLAAHGGRGLGRGRDGGRGRGLGRRHRGGLGGHPGRGVGRGAVHNAGGSGHGLSGVVLPAQALHQVVARQGDGGHANEYHKIETLSGNEIAKFFGPASFMIVVHHDTSGPIVDGAAAVYTSGGKNPAPFAFGGPLWYTGASKAETSGRPVPEP